MQMNYKRGLETLLMLDGEVFPMESGYWTKFEVKRVEVRDVRPHGIKYSLTLHNAENIRVLGYDNAHSVLSVQRKSHDVRTAWDHKHHKERITIYKFKSPGKLLEDFWEDVNRIITLEQDGGNV